MGRHDAEMVQVVGGDEKKRDEKEKMEELHQHKVEKTIKSAEGSAGLLHNITKPAAWRGGAQILNGRTGCQAVGPM